MLTSLRAPAALKTGYQAPRARADMSSQAAPARAGRDLKRPGRALRRVSGSAGARGSAESARAGATRDFENSRGQTSIGFKSKTNTTSNGVLAHAANGAAAAGVGSEVVIENNRTEQAMPRSTPDRWRGNAPGPTALELGKEHPVIIALQEADCPDDLIAHKLSAFTLGHVVQAYVDSWHFPLGDAAGKLNGPPVHGRVLQAIQNAKWDLPAVRDALRKLPQRLRINEPKRSELAKKCSLALIEEARRITLERVAQHEGKRSAISSPSGLFISLIESGEAFASIVDRLRDQFEKQEAAAAAPQTERTRSTGPGPAAAAPDQAACLFRVKIQNIADDQLQALWSQAIADLTPGTADHRLYHKTAKYKLPELRDSIIASHKARALLEAVLIGAGTAGGKVSV